MKNEVIEYNIKWIKSGTVTDPEGMVAAMRKFMNSKEFDRTAGDLAIILLDTDCEMNKIKLVKRLQKDNPDIKIIVSNPCFEIWFLAHFEFSTRQFKNSKAVKLHMQKYIKGYTESMDVSDIINPNMGFAIDNIKRLKEYYNNLGVSWDHDAHNPMTDIVDLFEIMGFSK